MGYAARLKRAQLEECPDCKQPGRLVPYIRHADGSLGYTCETCKDEWKQMGILYED